MARPAGAGAGGVIVEGGVEWRLTTRRNRYARCCESCGVIVDAGDGVLVRVTIAGTVLWEVWHPACAGEFFGVGTTR